MLLQSGRQAARLRANYARRSYELQDARRNCRQQQIETDRAAPEIILIGARRDLGHLSDEQL